MVFKGYKNNFTRSPHVRSPKLTHIFSCFLHSYIRIHEIKMLDYDPDDSCHSLSWVYRSSWIWWTSDLDPGSDFFVGGLPLL